MEGTTMEEMYQKALRIVKKSTGVSINNELKNAANDGNSGEKLLAAIAIASIRMEAMTVIVSELFDKPEKQVQADLMLMD